MLKFIFSVFSTLVFLNLIYCLVYLSKLTKKTECELILLENQISIIEDVRSGKIELRDE